MENATTVNPHDKWTDSQGVSGGKPSDPQPSGGGSSSDGNRDWVPGWGIALLVLAAAILLLLIIVFVMMVSHQANLLQYTFLISQPYITLYKNDLF